MLILLGLDLDLFRPSDGSEARYIKIFAWSLPLDDHRIIFLLFPHLRSFSVNTRKLKISSSPD